MMRSTFAFALAFSLTTLSSQGFAQAPDPGRMAAQKEAMAPLAFMDGVWRGPAWTLLPTGRHEVTQTERIGPFLDGSVKVLEGRGYNADGTVGFNALGIISFDPATKKYSMRSYALGYSGDFPLEPRADGYVWQVPAGPGAIIRYTATIAKGHWREVGERVAGDAPPVQIFEMNLTRVGDTSWPSGEPVPMK